MVVQKGSESCRELSAITSQNVRLKAEREKRLERPEGGLGMLRLKQERSRRAMGKLSGTRKPSRLEVQTLKAISGSKAVNVVVKKAVEVHIKAGRAKLQVAVHQGASVNDDS